MRMGICLCACIIVLKSKGNKCPFRLCIKICTFKGSLRFKDCRQPVTASEAVVWKCSVERPY